MNVKVGMEAWKNIRQHSIIPKKYYILKQNDHYMDNYKPFFVFSRFNETKFHPSHGFFASSVGNLQDPTNIVF
jgi:hypothetical protein